MRKLLSIASELTAVLQSAATLFCQHIHAMQNTQLINDKNAISPAPPDINGTPSFWTKYENKGEKKRKKGGTGNLLFEESPFI